MEVTDLDKLAPETNRPTWGDYLILALLPWLLLPVDPSWLASPLFLDPYIYFGYYLDLPAHLDAFPDHYISTRLPALLPGWLAHSILPPRIANASLHLLIYYLSVYSLYAALRRVAGRRAALLAGVILGGSPFFLGAVGTDYTDGYAIAYTLLAVALLQTSALAARPARWLLGGGAALAALVFTNVFFTFFGGLAGLYFLGANRSGRRHALPTSLVWLAGGFLLLTGLLVLINWGLCGRPWFFLPTLKASVELARGHTHFQHHPWSWLLDAAWLAFPVGGLLGGVLWVLLRPGNETTGRRLPLALLAVAVATLLILEKYHLGVIRFWYYATPLLPFLLLAIGRQLGGVCARLSPGGFGWAVVAAVVGNLAIALVPAQSASWSAGRVGAFVGPVAIAVAAFVVLALLRPVRVALPGFLLLLAGSQAWARSAFRYESPWPEEPVALYERIRAHDGERQQVLQAVADTYRVLQALDRAADLPFWYQFEEAPGLVYREISCTHFLRNINESFPKTDAGLLTSRQSVVLLSQDPQALRRAEQALAPLGLRATLLFQKPIECGRFVFTITVIELHACATGSG